MAKKQVYGIALRGPNKGKLTECNAQNPDTCNFHKHGSHQTMTEEEYQEKSEELVQKSMSGQTLLRKDQSTKKQQPTPKFMMFSGSGDLLNKFIASKPQLSAKDINRIHDEYFERVRPINGWTSTENIYCHQVVQSRLNPELSAEEYVATFKNSKNDTMYLTIQRDKMGNILSSIEEIKNSNDDGYCIVDIPSNHSNKKDYEDIWKRINDNPTPAKVKRELVVVPGGRLAGLDTTVDENGKPGVPRPRIF